MKRIILLLLLFLSIQGLAQKPLAPNIRRLKNDTIVWRADSLLHKEDFKARPRTNGPLGLSALGILLYPAEDGGELVFYVEALFVKSKSYIVKYSEYVLKHEQIHFDICELYARKLRKKISEINFKKVKNMQEQISKAYKKIMEDYLEEQNKYDTETEHGLNPVKQKDWNEKIQIQLKELDSYSPTLINISK